MDDFICAHLEYQKAATQHKGNTKLAQASCKGKTAAEVSKAV
jgi:hypothetical protein